MICLLEIYTQSKDHLLLSAVSLAEQLLLNMSSLWPSRPSEILCHFCGWAAQNARAWRLP